MYKKIILILIIFVSTFAITFTGCEDTSDEDSCPGSIISSCVDTCPENCAAQGKIEICVGAGYEPNRCCYCE